MNMEQIHTINFSITTQVNFIQKCTCRCAFCIYYVLSFQNIKYLFPVCQIEL